MSGRFITFEGIDGGGKSSHVEAVAQRLRGAGATVVCTREPGGTPLAERLRELLLHTAMDPLTEALLAFAARRDHVQAVIAPALARGDSVLCERFTDATFAYQGSGRGVDAGWLAQLERWVHEGDERLCGANGKRRARVRDADRFEQQDLAFFERVRAGYAARQQAAPGRFARIDATEDRSTVGRQIASVLVRRGW